ncbi:hypothetical protein [Duncaniella freteri]|jgi:hypothetical protein|uniref:Uncharacterized protein n=1 Tax=Duncaniella freteri TaxID=2530391 RepID=A0A4Z0V8P2_9BACT|nr:hypothetical protein [Duncaniella freteri]TGG40517.1 hypothetical protein EZ315_07445 [Duncaniella freteri]
MERFITATKETRELITKAFRGISRQTLWRALYFEDINKGTDTERKIRKMALNRGGIIMVVSPEMETMHDADGYMRQYYPNGVMLEADKTTGDVKVYDRDGNVSLSVEHAKISKLNEIQHHAKSL